MFCFMEDYICLKFIAGVLLQLINIKGFYCFDLNISNRLILSFLRLNLFYRIDSESDLCLVFSRVLSSTLTSKEKTWESFEVNIAKEEKKSSSLGPNPIKATK